MVCGSFYLPFSTRKAGFYGSEMEEGWGAPAQSPGKKPNHAFSHTEQDTIFVYLLFFINIFAFDNMDMSLRQTTGTYP